jgi:flagellar basal-body rod modification protein FlgD
MSTIESIATNTNLIDTNNSSGENTLGKEAFLNLLVTQLKYQDPLNPMENTEFVAQLSQFSSLEQLWNVNENLQTETLVSQSIHNSLVSSLVGKDVKALGNTTTLPEEGTANLGYTIAESATVTISIFDQSGNTVRTENVGVQEAGYYSTTWDGQDNNGNRVSAGEYTIAINAVDANGNAVETNAILRGQITGVRFVEGAPVLLMGMNEIDPADVLEVVLPESS